MVIHVVGVRIVVYAKKGEEMKAIEDIARGLAAPFPEGDLEWRVMRESRKGDKVSVTPYITSRAVMERLDCVVGIGGWEDTYERWNTKGVKCILKLRLNDEWLAKEDGADETDVEATKGGFSDALKRAAVKWGIGRYLYALPSFLVSLKSTGTNYHKVKNGPNKDKYLYWDIPRVPKEFLPHNEQEKVPASDDLGPPVDPLESRVVDWTGASPEARSERKDELHGVINFSIGDQMRLERLNRMDKEHQLACIQLMQQLTGYKIPSGKPPVEKLTVDQRAEFILFLENKAKNIILEFSKMKPKQQACYIVFLEEMQAGFKAQKQPEGNRPPLAMNEPA